MSVLRALLVFAVLILICSAYQVVASNKEVSTLLERHSYMPALLIYERDLDRLKEKSFLYERV